MSSDARQPATMERSLAELQRRRAVALEMGGTERVARHHATGRLTARERIAGLLDEGSFYEIGMLAEPELRLDRPVPGDGVITGLGRIDGRRVCIIAIDATILAGIIFTAQSDETGVDIYFGTGGAPEGVLAAAALFVSPRDPRRALCCRLHLTLLPAAPLVDSARRPRSGRDGRGTGRETFCAPGPRDQIPFPGKGP
jgi:hypothetical protein